MLELLTSNPLLFVIFALGLVVAITIHEFSHAWVADYLGDPTPRIQDRLTLNPLAHLDPVGTIMMVLIGFGWGKPVQFDPYNLKNRTRDAALISIAGPASNMVLAIALSIILHLFTSQLPDIAIQIMVILMGLNVSLAVFNLIPVAPLDGEKILVALLPKVTALEYQMFMRKNGMIVLIVLMLPLFGGVSLVSQLITPMKQFVMGLLLAGF